MTRKKTRRNESRWKWRKRRQVGWEVWNINESDGELRHTSDRLGLFSLQPIPQNKQPQTPPFSTFYILFLFLLIFHNSHVYVYYTSTNALTQRLHSLHLLRSCGIAINARQLCPLCQHSSTEMLTLSPIHVPLLWMNPDPFSDAMMFRECQGTSPPLKKILTYS